MTRNIVNNWATQCALPGCTNKTGYHKAGLTAKGTPTAKWKMFCTAHRTKLKKEVDQWKLKQGCSNTDAHYGFVCTATILYPEQLDVNHIDGDRHNNDPKNLECLCRNCHAAVTVQSGHHLTKYVNEVELNPEMFGVPA
jgi:hypothetical protein